MECTFGLSFVGRFVLFQSVLNHQACLRVFFFLQDEAFSLWQTHWGNIYPPNSPSRGVIDTFSSTYYLVNLVDNDYVKGNCLFEVVYDVLERLGKDRGPGST